MSNPVVAIRGLVFACMVANRIGLENKRIVFIGPSTSKSDYISLAYFAEYGTWPSQDIISYGLGKWGPNPISEAVVAQGAPHLLF